MGEKWMMLMLCSLLVPLAGMAQEVNHERRVDILPADNDSTYFSDPAIRENMEKWLHEMPTVVAPNASNILEPIEPDFLAKVALKDKPNFPKIDMAGIMSESEEAKTNFQLGKMGQWWQNQKENQAGGAMMLGVTIKIPISVLMRKIFPDKKKKRRERLQKILDEY